MTASKKYWLVVGLIYYGVIAFGQKNYPIHISFQNWVGDKLLSVDSTYTNPYNETFTVRNFRYYISHVSVGDNNGKVYNLPVGYFLVDERSPASKVIAAQIPFSAIRFIRFDIGVDSIKNVSGVQTGALDPANGMFWTWNSGYIFTKLEGSSPQAKAPQNNFTYHIGGFRAAENANRNVILKFKEPFNTSLHPEVLIKADINAWFDGVHSFKLADQPSIMTPGPQAMQVADNYSHMFSIINH